MNIFVSYASEYRNDADAIALALREEGHSVFFDRDALPAGDAYHARIRSAIEGSDLFVFLVAPESVESSSYAMTELGLARNRWPNPSGRILPVVIKPTPIQDIPEYVKAVTFVEPKGNVVADVVARVDRLARAARRRRLMQATAAALGLALAGAVAWMIRSSPETASACYLSVSVEDRAGAGAAPAALSLDVAYGGTSQAFIIPDGGAAAVQVGPLTEPMAPWTITVRSGDGSPLGAQEMRGCLSSAATFTLGGSLDLVVKPRQP
jgi:TIR domain